MEWKELNQVNQIESLKEESYEKPVLIFKHSTRCAISAMAINRLERQWRDSPMVPYFLDLINYREISNLISEKLEVIHESPQVILLKDGEVIHHTSHNDIDFKELNSIASS
ncbi:MAG: bacillithiol system redox-active protein YtxJ [Bacteroidota bacterium]